MFNNNLKVVTSEDGSNTAYSKEFQEHYHSTQDGALNETLEKHVIPAFMYSENLGELQILDICFGLGYNTLATLYYRETHFPNIQLKIYSPEFDAALVQSLKTFPYPKIFQKYRRVIESLVDNQYYKDAKTEINLFIGDARLYIKKLELHSLDVIYQDAFSPSVNPLLWTYEYFSDVVKLLKEDGIITTYSIALQIRLAMFQNGLNIYLRENKSHRASTVASKKSIKSLKKIDMKHKISCNKDVQPLLDLNFL